MEHVPAKDVFVTASSSSEWYEHLERRGSCLRLLFLLAKKRDLIHQLGPKGITVLHKGVDHGCVKLVKFILVNMFDNEGTCTCKVHGPDVSSLTREQLLRKTCEDDFTAVNIAVVSGSPKMILLLKWAIDKNKLELEQKTLSQKGVDSCRDDRRDRTRSTRGKGCEVEGEDLQCLFEAGVNEGCVPSTPTDAGPPDMAEEIREEISQSVHVTGSNLVVPDVKDHTIDQIYETDSTERIMIPKVYDLIERILENPGFSKFEPPKQAEVEQLKDECKKHVDFEFVPVSHVILHYLFSTYSNNLFSTVMEGVFKRIVCVCYEHDLEEGGSGSMVATLFKILDPRGRTILHATFDDDPSVELIFQLLDWIDDLDPAMTPALGRECVNSKDGAGRTMLHLFCIHANYDRLASVVFHLREKLDWDPRLSPLRCKEWDILRKWCFPFCIRKYYECNVINLAVIFNSRAIVSDIYENSKKDWRISRSYHSLIRKGIMLDRIDAFFLRPLQIAAFLGRATIVEEILKRPKNINSVSDLGLNKFKGFPDYLVLPAIHCAALSGQVEAMQSILKFPIYDPIIHDGGYFSNEGTALHLVLKRKNFNIYVEEFQTLALHHVLPNSKSYARVKSDFSKLHFDEHKPKMFSANEISCINLLLQAGIDIWTPHCRTGELPNPGPMANDEARKWWYDKVVTEVVTQKKSVSDAANATSVIATLVATASFIGPLQPPLGWAASDGYVHTSLIPVRVYLVCNSLSFYFSIASILMAVLPAIPMPKESLYDELFRSQRCLKAAALLLVISIICILISFTSASIAVVSSERHDKQLVGACIVVGGATCIVVLVIYIIRLLRMFFHRNDRFRRWFAKRMIF